MRFVRHAVYYAPRPGALADLAASWLGWDGAGGQAVAQVMAAQGLTAGAARYGFHGTLRAPFRLREGFGEGELAEAVAALAARLPAAGADGLRLADMDGFLALVPEGETQAIDDLAAAVVEATDPARAPLTEAEIARRRPEALTPRERALLDRWGYPYVMEAFRFHLTLTDRLSTDQIPGVMQTLRAHLGPLPQPFVIEDLCLFGEDASGRFHLMHRIALTG